MDEMEERDEFFEKRDSEPADVAYMNNVETFFDFTWNNLIWLMVNAQWNLLESKLRNLSKIDFNVNSVDEVLYF